MCTFEFDDNKSASNLSKHGIDFIQAQALWDDPDLIEVRANSTDEPVLWSLGVSVKSTGLE